MSTARLLSHLDLGPTTYLHASVVQNAIVSQFLAAKSSPTTIPSPPPTLLTASFPPTYTLGRRERGSLTPSQFTELSNGGKAEVHEVLRGGQTTYHGPGQLVAYPIVDLKSHSLDGKPAGLSARCYVRLLERSLIETLRHFGIEGFVNENTGVWTYHGSSSFNSSSSDWRSEDAKGNEDPRQGSDERKIAALGVHMRRFITSHGIALNVNTDLWWFDRIVACGLPGKRATSMSAEGVVGKSVQEVGDVFVKVLARGLGCDGVKRVSESEVKMEKRSD